MLRISPEVSIITFPQLLRLRSFTFVFGAGRRLELIHDIDRSPYIDVMAFAPVRYVPDMDVEKALPGSCAFISLPTTLVHGGQKVHSIVATPNPDMFRIPQLPAKRRPSKWTIFSLWFNTYRKFFVFICILNFIGIILAATGHWPYAVRYTGALILGNFHMSVLVRNEIVGRLLYLFVNTCFAKWTPLWFRLGCTSALQHLGGIHSGCALSGLAWLLFKILDNFRQRAVMPQLLLALGVMTLISIALTALAAVPWVRNHHHNMFERHHRFIGWIALLCTWGFTIAGDLYDPASQEWDLSAGHLFKQQDVWFVVFMTAFIVAPWACTRRVRVDVEIPSKRVAVLRFDRGMQQGLLGRISHSAVMEYHAFGTISEGPNAKYHYMVCGVQGDFTQSLVSNPPTTIWTRELKFAGVSNSSTLYKRGIRICTGTGIGAALSTCIQNPDWYLVWICSDPEKNFGPTIMNLIHKNIEPERLCIWDSRAKGGRPDTVQLVKRLYRSWKAEVVFITSNMAGNTELMQGCREAGIPAFGTLWDF